jgi:tetratricopeptide (TPR) repeat protein
MIRSTERALGRASRAQARSIVSRAVLAVSLLACTVPASGVAAQADEEARHRFEAGRRAYIEGRYDRALEDFREAYRQSHRPELLNNIAETCERLDLHREALEAYEQYVEAMRGAGRPITNAARVENRMRALRERLGTAQPSEPSARAGAASGPDPTSLVLGGVVAVVGASAAGVGIAGLVIREDAATSYNGGACDPTPAAPSSEIRCGAIRTDGEAWGTAGGVLLAIGAAAIAVGAALLIVGATSSPSEVAVACVPSADGIVCAGRF